MSILFSHFLSKNNEIRPQEADFTEVLSSIAVVPKMLYFYGKLPEKRVKSVAIVGTRKPTEYGARIAKKLAYDVAKRGAVVVSGLAYGIDSIAHRGALEAGGTTIAVLGTPIDYIYPRAHVGLAEEIVQTGGAVMSELAPGAEYHTKTCFLERNRIIAGLADVVVVVEAAERSGSLNTAAHALEQGKDIFAVPGDITRSLSKGCNKLLRQGAMPYLEPSDVLDVLLPVSKKQRKDTQMQLLLGDNEVETVILRLVAAGVERGEEILAKTGLKVAEFNQNIMMLEIKGRVMALGMNRWALK